MEDTRTGAFVFLVKRIFGFLGNLLVVRIDITQVFHLKNLVTPEDGVEGKLHGVRVVVAVISEEVIDGWVRHSFVLHEVAVHHPHTALRCHRETTAEALTCIGIGDILSAGYIDGPHTAARLVVIKQGVRHVADRIRSDTAAGCPRNELLV